MPKSIRQRRRVFVGCEGESERSYVALLQQLLGRQPAHQLVAEVLNGGDHLANIESAQKALRRQAVQGRDKFVGRYVLLDSDQRGRNLQRDADCEQLARKLGFHLIWQDPCHEALLLRHLEECTFRRPPTSADSMNQLRTAWPGYEKNLGKEKLGARIDVVALSRVRRVEPALEHLLLLIGLASPDR